MFIKGVASKNFRSLIIFGRANNLVASKSSCTHSSSGTNVKSLNFTRRSTSSALNVKRLNAEIKLKIVQLEADHLKDHIEEENATLVRQQQMH